MSITIADITFDQVRCHADGDVLYLHDGDASTAVEFDASAEDHSLRFDAVGALVGVTAVNARWLLERRGAISGTLPASGQVLRLGPEQLSNILRTASAPSAKDVQRRTLQR
jgi:hypothetical protein